jgi:hypothetical protein
MSRECEDLVEEVVGVEAIHCLRHLDQRGSRDLSVVRIMTGYNHEEGCITH